MFREWHGHEVRKLLAEGQIVVVRTEDDWFLGTADMAGDNIVVLSGYVGRPVVLDAELVQSVIPAQQHPEVLEMRASSEDVQRHLHAGGQGVSLVADLATPQRSVR